MSKIIDKAKLFDDPAFANNIADAIPLGYTKIRPPLQAACDCAIWNMDMVKILIEEGGVNVNAHQQVPKNGNHHYADKIVPGPTALHVLAKGDFWWQVNAIKYLVEHGMVYLCF